MSDHETTEESTLSDRCVWNEQTDKFDVVVSVDGLVLVLKHGT